MHRTTSVRHADCSIEDTCRGSIVRRVSVFSYHRRRVLATRLSLFLSFSFPLYHLLSRQFPSSSFTFDYFLLLLCCRPCCFEFARKAKRVSRGKPNDVQDRVFFLKRPDDALMRSGLCGWTEARILLEIVTNKGRANRGLRTSLGSSRRSLVSCWDLPLFN